MKLLTLLLALPLAASAQLQLYLAPAGGTEIAFTGVHDMGQVAVAESVSTRFRLRNLGETSVTLTHLYVAGAGFTMTGAPSMPFVLASGVNVDFTVRFTPANSGSYSANLQINGSGYIVRGTGLAGATLRLGSQDLANGSDIDLGRVERGESSNVMLTLINTTSDRVTVESIALTGAAAFTTDAAAPVVLAPGASSSFSIIYRPTASGIATGTLTVDRRTFRLTGTCFEPTLPRPTIVIESGAIRSGQQGRVSVRLASVSKAYATGQLRMELRPAGTVRDNDAAAMFTSGSRTVVFNISPGDQDVKLRSENSITFQSGTTAGTIVFTVEAGGFTEQGFVVVSPEPVKLDQATAVRSASSVDLTLAGFDNTRSLREIGFTFFSNGQPMANMPVRAQVASDFDKWWATSTLGGIFQLKAAFPVTGDASKITGVEMTLTSSAGTTTTERIAF